MWSAIASIAAFLLSLVTRRKAEVDKQAGRDAQKVDETAQLNKQVIDAKSEDIAAANSASGSSAQWLRDNCSRPD